jgi:hypothetical protein
LVKINSPLQSKDLDISADIKGFFRAHTKGITVYDNNRMVILNLKKGENLAVFDRNNKPWELSKDYQGRLYWRKL